ncbi:MAG: AAA-like domain-containing protein, partial [Cyanobacteria bacterium J06581_3]
MVDQGFESRADASLYTVGGTVQANEGGLYISRRADGELLQLCEDSKFAYVLTPRQMGKSSLMIRTAERLIDDGRQAVIVDLTQLGTQLSADEWYSDFLDLVASQLMLATDVKRWWRENGESGLALRLTRFFQEVVLAEVSEPVVVFVDEIDTTLSLAFTDDFYAAIRYLYVARSTDSRLRRLSFVLIGVATPADLIRDPKRTPFNIGQRVDLADFSAQEALPLAAGLGLAAEKEEQVLDGVLAWTGGHPYLTQRLCRALVERTSTTLSAPQSRAGWTAASTEEVVAPVVAETFFGRMSEQDNNLQFVRDMLTKRAPQSLDQEVLTTYREIYRDRQPVLDEEQNLVKSHLKLSGVVRREGKHLQVRNRIYQEVFGEQWIREHLPESFWQRYKPVLKWAIPVTAASVLSAGVMAGLAQDARESAREAKEQTELAQQSAQEAEKQRKIAQAQTALAEQNAQEAERQKEIAQENEATAEEALEKEQAANEQRTIALTTAETQRQRAEEQASIAQQQRQRAQTQATLAQEQTRRAETQANLAEQQTKLAEQQTMVAQLREQVARVLSLLPTSNAVSGLVIAIDTMARSPSVPDVAMAAQSSLLKAVQVSQEMNRLEGHGSEVYSVAFSPDNQRIVSG